ncbi:MAG: ABC transporter permease [Solirubrobacteraceae bacterium]|jgi:ribose transport system permease protein
MSHVPEIQQTKAPILEMAGAGNGMAGSGDVTVSTGAEGVSSGEGAAKRPVHSTALSLLLRVLRFESTSVLLATLALGAVIGILHPEFLSSSQIRDVLQESVYVAIIAGGMAFLIAMREIDLSAGSVFGLTLIIAALFMQGGMNPYLAVAISTVLAGGMGLVNAILVQAIRIPAIVATLATLAMFRGLAIALSNGEQVSHLPINSSFFTFFGGNTLGLPVSVWVLLVVAIVLTALLRLTPFGHRVRAIGSNPEAASFSGISIPRVRIQALVLMGVLSGIAGILGLAFFASGEPNIGSGFELEAIAAAIIGGTSLAGGSATVIGAMIGAVLLTEVNAGLVYFDVPQNWSSFATGAVILAAVALDSIVRRRGKGRAAGGLGL